MYFIKSTVLPVERVYQLGQLQLPWFQRAYAWDESHVGRLVSDLFEQIPKGRYSLGHMSLARPQGSLVASIIDGHQRSISLTMLFALLRDLIGDGPMADRLHRVVAAPEGGWRLMPQRGLAEFFERYVQLRNQSLVEPMEDLVLQSLSEQNIIRNRDHMARMLREKDRTWVEWTTLARFLLEDCLLIVDEVEDEEEARDLMQREEDTGLPPHNTELAKATILTAMPSHEQEEAAGLFESAQSLLTADDMSSLLPHIRLLKARKRSARAVNGELIKLFQLDRTGIPFLKDELLPRAAAMARLKRRTVGSGAAREATGRSLELLFWITDHQLWVPAALHWLQRRGEDYPETPLFFERLDRLTWLMKIASVDPTDQEIRFLRVLDAIDKGRAVEAIEPLAIERRLLATALENLRSRTFYLKRFHGLVLRRISQLLDPQRTPAAIDGEAVTVEHILPRRPDAGWRRWYPSQSDIVDHCNRLGNLAFLSQEVNNQIANSDWPIKRFVLANHGGTFVLCAHAAEREEWTKATIIERGEDLIAVLLRSWGLEP
jgi:hypothetical protein